MESKLECILGSIFDRFSWIWGRQNRSKQASKKRCKNDGHQDGQQDGKMAYATDRGRGPGSLGRHPLNRLPRPPRRKRFTDSPVCQSPVLSCLCLFLSCLGLSQPCLTLSWPVLSCLGSNFSPPTWVRKSIKILKSRF